MSIPVQDEIRSMMYDGLSNKEIAKRTGFGRSTISGYRRKWNLPSYKKLCKAPITAKYMVNSRKPDRYVSNRMGKRVMVNSYEVKHCPRFERG